MPNNSPQNAFAKEMQVWYGYRAMKKHVFTVFLLLLALVLSMTACLRGQPEPTPTPVPTATPDPHEGEVAVTDGFGGIRWVKDAPNLRLFPYHYDDFTVMDQVPQYSQEGLVLRRGIDISEHQQDIDWQQVASSGIEYAIIRCGYRTAEKGELHEDARFREYVQGALDAGLDVGVYFFSQALNIVEAAEEAVFTLHLIRDYNITLPVFFDWEFMGADYEARTDNMDGRMLTDCCLEFAHLVRAGGYQPGMYCYLNLAYDTYVLNDLTDITLWLGDPGTRPIFYFDHSFWQYSFTGTVPGIGVDVDLDAMYIPVETGGAVG